MEIVLIWIVCAILSAVVASSKGRSGFGWFLLGFFLGPLGLLAAIGVSKTEARIYSPPQSALRPCPVCAEMIQPAAKKCRFCGTDVEAVQREPSIAISGESEVARMLRLQNEARGKVASPRPEPWSAKSKMWAAVAGSAVLALIVILVGLQKAGVLPPPKEVVASSDSPNDTVPSPSTYVARIAPGADDVIEARNYPKLAAQIGKENFKRTANKIPTAAQYAARNAACDQVDIVSISSASSAQAISFFANCLNGFQNKFSEADLDAYIMGSSRLTQAK